MDNSLVFHFDLTVAAAYALLVLALLFVYRRAKSTGMRLAVYVISVVLVVTFILLFAPR